METIPRVKIRPLTSTSAFIGIPHREIESRRLDTTDPLEALANLDLSQGQGTLPPDAKSENGFRGLGKSFTEATLFTALVLAVLFVPELVASSHLLASESWVPLLSKVSVGLAVFVIIFILRTRLRVQKSLYPSPRELFQKFTSELPGMIYQCRVSPTGHTTLTYANDAISWIYEKDPSEMRADASPILDLVHPDDRQRVWESLLESTLTLKPWKGEYRVVLPKQGVRWRSAHALVERMPDGGTLWHGFIADATARKEAEQEILRSKERFDLASKAGEVGVWEFDFSSRKITLNEVLCDILDLEADSPKSLRNCLARIHPEERRHLLESIRVREILGGIIEQEFRILRRDNNIRHGFLRAMFVRNNDGSTRAIGTMIDITATRQAEQELAKAKELAESTNEAKGDFLAMVSHDIRTPMNGLLGLIDLLKDSRLTPEQLENVLTMEACSEHLLALASNLVDFTSLEINRMEVNAAPFDVRIFIDEIYCLHKPTAEEKDLDFRYEIADDIPEIATCDRVRLAQVLNNLIVNAIKFTEKGHVLLRISPTAANDDGARSLSIGVEDSGPGIPERELPHIFDSFYHAKNHGGSASKGSGLGLAISKRLCDLMQGSLTVSSIVDTGSTFTATVAAFQDTSSSES